MTYILFVIFIDFKKFNTYRNLSERKECRFGKDILPNKSIQNPITELSRRYTTPAAEHRKTSLYDFHVELNGKMVPFGGYLLPVITETRKA
jgi:hypothetical protein